MGYSYGIKSAYIFRMFWVFKMNFFKIDHCLQFSPVCYFGHVIFINKHSYISIERITLNNWHYNLCANSFVSIVPKNLLSKKKNIWDCYYHSNCCRGPALLSVCSHKKMDDHEIFLDFILLTFPFSPLPHSSPICLFPWLFLYFSSLRLWLSGHCKHLQVISSWLIRSGFPHVGIASLSRWIFSLHQP